MVLFSAPNRAALLLAGLADAAAAWWKATTQEIKEPSAQIVNQGILLEHGHGPLFIVSPILHVSKYSTSRNIAFQNVQFIIPQMCDNLSKEKEGVLITLRNIFRNSC